MSNNRLSHLKTAFLASSMLTLASAEVAYAQDAGPETVVVTGSRLSSAGFVAPTPVTSIGAPQIVADADTNIADVLNTIPEFRLSVGASQNNVTGSSGVQTADLRGLGSTRTLILMDGNRFVPTSLGSAVDENLLPVLLVQRVDVVTGGASAAYGSDAVAGVVNFVMKDRMDGIQGDAGGGVSQQGDNTEQHYSLAAGTNFFGDRLHAIGSLEYTNNQGVMNIYSRPQEYGNQQACLLAPTPAQRTAGNLPSEIFVNDCTYSTQAAGTLVTGGLTATGATSTAISNITFGPGGTVLPFNVGTVSSANMYGGPPNPTDPHASPRNGAFIEQPEKRLAFYDKETWDITDDMSAWAQVNWGWHQTTSATSFIQNTGLIIPITGQYANPYVPASLQSAAIAAGLTSLTVGRQEESVGGQNQTDNDIVSRGAFGLKGKAFGDWSWDIFYTHGESLNKNFATGVELEGNYLESIFAVAGPTGPVCGPVSANPNLATGAVGAGRASQVSTGCQPYNIFGPTVGAYPSGPRCFACIGVPSAIINNPTGSEAAVDYFTHTTPSGTYYQQDDFVAGLNGSPFSTWAGPVSLAVGFEHRREGGRSYTDFDAANAYAQFNTGSNYNGQFSTNEGYFEVDAPLLKDGFLAESVDIDTAFRETGYSLYGVLPTYKVGLNWQIDDNVRVRATRSRDVREPTISDLFSPITTGPNQSFTNPITHLTGIEFTQSGGNPNLKTENADSYTTGIVYTPTDGWFAGLNASVDWYQVIIHNVITTVSAIQIANQCATGVQIYCALIQPTGGPGGTLLIQAASANLSSQKTSGMDFEFSYSSPLDYFNLPGQVTARWLTTFTDYQITKGVSVLEAAGASQGQAKYVSNFNLTYVLDPSTTNIQLRYTSGLLSDATLIGPGQKGYSPTLANSVSINQFPSSYYIDLSENYDVYTEGNMKFTLYFNVNNLLDKDPPGDMTAMVAFLSGGDPYDLIGRTFKAGIRFKL